MNFTIQQNIPLSTVSTFGIGGNAKQLIVVDAPEKLIEVVRWAQRGHHPFKIFAGGSNIVFPDEGTDHLLIRFFGGEINSLDTRLIVDCGVLLMDIISQAISQGLAGLESLSGIPGTVGGAIVGNAGAYGHAISEVVHRVEIFQNGTREWIEKDDCQFSYRNSIFKTKPFVLLRAELQFSKGDREVLQKKSQEIITMRLAKYHPGLKCPGSFFKNVLVKDVDTDSLAKVDTTKIIDGKIPAGYLLTEIGAREMKVGDIEIADFHGNLFINRGKGTAKDVKQLAQILKDKVKQRFSIDLEEEIRYF